MTEPQDRTLSHFDGRPRRAGTLSPRPHLYRVLQCERPLAAPSRHSLGDLDAVLLGRGEPTTVRAVDGDVRRLTLRVSDRWMSGAHAQLTKVLGRWVLEDQKSKNGTRVNGAPVERAMLADGDLVECGHTFFLYRDAVEALPAGPENPPDIDAAQLAVNLPGGAAGLLTLVPPLQRELAVLVEVARSPIAVMIGGESGTGKELCARAVHRLSGRGGEFVAVNCGALPETLIESELFGARKGAFSGATDDRPGLVRASDRGTLFLDEIGDLPLSSQAAFLRVLQEREVVPVGATRAQKVDLRLVSATHRNLATLVAEGRFRADLLARIAGFQLTLPPLRERREDLGLLVAALLERAVAGIGTRVDSSSLRLGLDAARALFRYRFPLNIRELEKCLSTALVLALADARGGECTLELGHLPDELQAALTGKAVPPEPLDTDEDEPPGEAYSKFREDLVALLREHGGNVSAVARAMGKARMQVQRWLKRYRLDPESFRR